MSKRRASGEGNLYYWEDKKLWVGRISFEGKRKVKYGKTQKEVREWMVEVQKAIKDGRFVADDTMTVSQFLDRYLKDFAIHDLKPSTFHNYSTMIRLYINPEIGNIKLTQLKVTHLHALYEKRRKDGLSPRMVQYIHGLLHRTLNRAVKWGLITVNPCDLAEAPKNKKTEMNTWTAEQVKQFFSVIEGDRWEAIYYVAMAGLREGEILALQWKNVNLPEGYLQVTQNLQYIPRKGLVFSQPKSEKSKSRVTLPDFVIEALGRHRGRQDALKTGVWKENGLVFTTNIGTAISPRNLVRHFKTKLKEAGLPEIRFHDLRHTVATLLLEKNVHPLIVAEQLRHANINLTLSTYSHILPSMGKVASDQLDDIFKPVSRPDTLEREEI